MSEPTAPSGGTSTVTTTPTASVYALPPIAPVAPVAPAQTALEQAKPDQAEPEPSRALTVAAPAKLPVPLGSPKDFAAEVQKWRDLPPAERSAKRPEIEALIVDHDDKAEINKSRALVSTVIVSTLGGSLTVTSTVAVLTTLGAGGAVTALAAAPVAIGAATLVGGLWVVSYFYSTARKQAKTAKLLGIMLKEGDRPSDGPAQG